MNEQNIEGLEALHKSLQYQILVGTVINVSDDIVADICKSATQVANCGNNAQDPRVIDAIKHVTEVLTSTILSDIHNGEKQNDTQK